MQVFQLKKELIKIILLLIIFIFLLWAFPAFSETVNATWNPNPESDLAGYKIYYGTTSGDYDQNIDVGNEVSWFINNLIVSAIYYFVATAYDFAGNESLHSNEVSLLITGIDRAVLNFKDCDEVKTYNILGQQVKSDRSQLPSGFYIRRCFVGDSVVWTNSMILVK